MVSVLDLQVFMSNENGGWKEGEATCGSEMLLPHVSSSPTDQVSFVWLQPFLWALALHKPNSEDQLR